MAAVSFKAGKLSKGHKQGCHCIGDVYTARFTINKLWGWPTWVRATTTYYYHDHSMNPSVISPVEETALPTPFGQGITQQRIPPFVSDASVQSTPTADNSTQTPKARYRVPGCIKSLNRLAEEVKKNGTEPQLDPHQICPNISVSYPQAAKTYFTIATGGLIAAFGCQPNLVRVLRCMADGPASRLSNNGPWAFWPSSRLRGPRGLQAGFPRRCMRGSPACKASDDSP